jgi:aerobic-type carbon monoxide dehydrogenase small subunit (CoxS/CutS family)
MKAFLQYCASIWILQAANMAVGKGHAALVPVGKKITTIEGLEQSGKLHAVQTAFVNADAFQCAYCASGMIMSAVSLLQKNANPSDEEIMREMQGNICRCGIYPRIIKAIREASTV